MEFKGRVKKVIEKTFAKKDGTGDITTYEIVVEELDKEYPQVGVFEPKKDVPIPNEGEVVTVIFNMRANEWEGKFFGKNQAWKIESERLDNTPIGQLPHNPNPDAGGLGGPVPTQLPQTESDDLPF